ncbi:dehydrogenase [Methylopila jiangsuensis]|uniref:Dehydrogenase n=1 Tax=Methylopila jiangsuensis TaxID=586230 RepID=A0A9W6N3U5_9HYPH|nr:glucose 1-dehydrogenase [Methylopila jiangsuensis]MDR6286987.1 NAD(P)-dependent dehydrogenase (short-subunit alcohol dehydrogenase family) [Methylopila jiangsuensis]GLK76663.1 dehydrogenase [Methylopila jiangsuensis]
MSVTVAGKVVVITGAGAGIGRAAAELFAKGGAKVVATDINLDGLEETAKLVENAGSEALIVKHDVASEDQWINVFKQAKDKFGGVDVLVNNAGIYIISPVTDISLETWNKLMAINVTGVFLGCKHVVPYMQERNGGSIINLSSIAGLQGSAGHALYGASKGAVRLMSKDLGAELAGMNIRVNSVHPTYVKTAMADYAEKVSGMSADELGKKLTAIGRLAETSDIANMIVFLAADESNYLTASEFVVDGGGTSVTLF